jgi:hypothetical protein
MELAHPAGAEPLAPQPSQLASAIASTKKSLLANFAQPQWPSPAESECHPGCPKDQKKCSRPCATGASYWPSGWRAERQDDDGSRRTASPHTTGLLVSSPSIAGECVHLSGTQNNCKCLQIWLSFGKNTSFECSKPSIQPTPRCALHWLDGPIFVFGSLQNVSWHGRAVPETYSPALSRMCSR